MFGRRSSRGGGGGGTAGPPPDRQSNTVERRQTAVRACAAVDVGRDNLETLGGARACRARVREGRRFVFVRRGERTVATLPPTLRARTRFVGCGYPTAAARPVRPSAQPVSREKRREPSRTHAHARFSNHRSRLRCCQLLSRTCSARARTTRFLRVKLRPDHQPRVVGTEINDRVFVCIIQTRLIRGRRV